MSWAACGLTDCCREVKLTGPGSTAPGPPSTVLLLSAVQCIAGNHSRRAATHTMSRAQTCLELEGAPLLGLLQHRLQLQSSRLEAEKLLLVATGDLETNIPLQNGQGYASAVTTLSA